jgi:hypothetical protein
VKLTLIDNNDLKVAVLRNASSEATLCFTGIGHAIGGIDIQSEEFVKSSNYSTSIFIVDKKRSWGNNIDFVRLKQVISHYVTERTIHSIGNSMGGFLAVLATKFFNIKTVVAFAPQYTVSKKILPTKSRFDLYVNEINCWVFESLADCFNHTTNYYILAGVGGADDKHLELIPNQRNIHKVYFQDPGFIHNTAQRLKQEGLLYEIIRDCFASRTAAEIVEHRLADKGYRSFSA